MRLLRHRRLALALGISVGALALAATALGANPDGLQWRYGPLHNAVNAAETTITTSNVSSLGLAWSATVTDNPRGRTDAGGVVRSPAVLGNAVYATSGDG